MDTRTGSSIFAPYYSRIQELLFSGMSIKVTYEYVVWMNYESGQMELRLD